uniref:Uncharacterized protein n=1 Tax=Oryzias sinensis TaxID=183150 RepID=A0A8C7X2W8_9TELE
MAAPLRTLASTFRQRQGGVNVLGKAGINPAIFYSEVYRCTTATRVAYLFEIFFFSCFEANGNDSKKFKGDLRGPNVPSRVLHIRKLPIDITETEVISLGLPFGDVTNLLMLKAKNQVKSFTVFLSQQPEKQRRLHAKCSFE